MNPQSPLSALLWGLQQLDRPGAALRGLVGGRPSELGRLVPFSDELGLTSPENLTYGHQLLGGDTPLAHAGGFGIDLASGLWPSAAVLGGALAKKAVRAGIKRVVREVTTGPPPSPGYLTKAETTVDDLAREMSEAPLLQGDKTRMVPWQEGGLETQLRQALDTQLGGTKTSYKGGGTELGPTSGLFKQRTHMDPSRADLGTTLESQMAEFGRPGYTAIGPAQRPSSDMPPSMRDLMSRGELRMDGGEWWIGQGPHAVVGDTPEMAYQELLKQWPKNSIKPYTPGQGSPVTVLDDEGNTVLRPVAPDKRSTMMAREPETVMGDEHYEAMMNRITRDPRVETWMHGRLTGVDESGPASRGLGLDPTSEARIGRFLGGPTETDAVPLNLLDELDFGEALARAMGQTMLRPKAPKTQLAPYRKIGLLTKLDPSSFY